MPRECSDGLGRRSVLQTLGAMSVGGTAGCSGLFSDDQPEHVTDSPVDNDQPEHATDSPVDDDQPEHDTAWPMFRYDRRHTGFTNIGGIGIPADQWVFETGYEVRSSPATMRGTVYVGSDDTHVYAVEMVDGTERWAFETGAEVCSSPAAVGDTVYVGSDDTHVYALDAETGTEQWHFQTGDNVISSPAVVNDTVYVGSLDASIYAVDSETGTEQWGFPTDGDVISSPAVRRGTVYVGSDDTHVYAVDAETGIEQWAFETDGKVRSSPVVVGGTVYIGSDDNHVYAVNAETGTEQWAFKTNDKVRSSPAVPLDTLYVGSDDNHVYRVDGETGTEQWAFETDDKVRSSPVVVQVVAPKLETLQDTVVIGSGNSLYALDAEKGFKQWAFETDASGRSSPVVTAGGPHILLWGSAGPNVYGFPIEKTKLAFRPPLRSPTATLVASDDESLMFGQAVALDGDTVLIGDSKGGVGRTGATYVFERAGTEWRQEAKLVAAGRDRDFGRAVAMAGDTALIGAPLGAATDGQTGRAYVYERATEGWQRQATLVPDDGDSDDRFGISVAVDGTTALVGASKDDTPAGPQAGTVYVFERTGGEWDQQAKLIATDGESDHRFGWAVDLDGDTAIIGAVHATSAYVFDRADGGWHQQTILADGDDEAHDLFGVSVAVDGATTLVGASRADHSEWNNVGSAYVFEQTRGEWHKTATLTHNNGNFGDAFGSAVELDGGTALVGAVNDDDPNGLEGGSAFVFERAGGTWAQQEKLAGAPPQTSREANEADHFGSSVAVDGNTVLIGAMHEGDSGRAYVFNL